MFLKVSLATLRFEKFQSLREVHLFTPLMFKASCSQYKPPILQPTRRRAERRGGGRRGRAATVFGRVDTDFLQTFARCVGDVVGS